MALRPSALSQGWRSGASVVMSIYIPVQGSEESVEVHVDSLPENIDDLSDILQARLPNPPFTPLPRTLDHHR